MVDSTVLCRYIGVAIERRPTDLKGKQYSFALDLSFELRANRNSQGPRIFTGRTGREFRTEEDAALDAFEYAVDGSMVNTSRFSPDL